MLRIPFKTQIYIAFACSSPWQWAVLLGFAALMNKQVCGCAPATGLRQGISPSVSVSSLLSMFKHAYTCVPGASLTGALKSWLLGGWFITLPK